MKGVVTGHYVAIKPDEVKKKSDAGLVLPEEYDLNHRSRAEAATTIGTVVSIGPDAWRAFGSEKPWARLGDRVVYVKHVSKIVEDKDDLDDEGHPKKLFIMTDENVIWNLDAETEE